MAYLVFNYWAAAVRYVQREFVEGFRCLKSIFLICWCTGEYDSSYVYYSVDMTSAGFNTVSDKEDCYCKSATTN